MKPKWAKKMCCSPKIISKLLQEFKQLHWVWKTLLAHISAKPCVQYSPYKSVQHVQIILHVQKVYIISSPSVCSLAWLGPGDLGLVMCLPPAIFSHRMDTYSDRLHTGHSQEVT